jgi:large subunit ribosomal protein L19
MDLLKKVSQSSLRAKPIGDFKVGDTVDVHTKIKEGDKERIQIFNGTVIARSNGHGEINDSFTVRRIVAGEGVERCFPVHSPRIDKVEVTRLGQVRRSKLYYLRDRVGKSTKVREQLSADDASKA